ncbi:hypothetical protein CKO24_13335, partial [Rhodothalassium salexigens DSM 2132]
MADDSTPKPGNASATPIDPILFVERNPAPDREQSVILDDSLETATDDPLDYVNLHLGADISLPGSNDDGGAGRPLLDADGAAAGAVASGSVGDGPGAADIGLVGDPFRGAGDLFGPGSGGGGFSAEDGTVFATAGSFETAVRGATDRGGVVLPALGDDVPLAGLDGGDAADTDAGTPDTTVPDGEPSLSEIIVAEQGDDGGPDGTSGDDGGDPTNQAPTAGPLSLTATEDGDPVSAALPVTDPDADDT